MGVSLLRLSRVVCNEILFQKLCQVCGLRTWVGSPPDRNRMFKATLKDKSESISSNQLVFLLKYFCGSYVGQFRRFVLSSQNADR